LKIGYQGNEASEWDVTMVTMRGKDAQGLVLQKGYSALMLYLGAWEDPTGRDLSIC
ncbi:hypothetical protein TNCT_493801, partial [Trichonephila clavata]